MKDALSQRGARRRTKGATTGRTSKAPSKLEIPRGTDWERLRHISDREIRKGITADPDAHVTDEQFWKNAKVVWPERKEIVTIRLDADLLRWFRQRRGYQTRINAVLRAYMAAHS